MAKRKENREAIVEIDPMELDREWVRQPRLVMKYAEQLAAANERLDAAKADFDATKAEIDRDIRADPDRFGISKITETTVANAIVLQDDYRDAQDDVIKRKYERDLLQAVVNALEHRKRALEGLVSLHGMDYFSSPKTDRESQEALAETTKRSVRTRGQRARRRSGN